MKAYAQYLCTWLEAERREFYHMDGYVLGVSGGVDSAVVAHLLARTGAPVYGLILPAVAGEDTRDAHRVLQSAGIAGAEVSIAPLYAQLQDTLQPLLASGQVDEKVLRGNMQARLRMIMLYSVAQSRRALVVGTDNAAEWHTGYFTKFGDGAADVVPLIQLRKEEVYELARELGVPDEIINKTPSAGLWPGQSDEGEMGVSYKDIDAFLRGETVSAAAQERIAFWHKRSHHKRQLPRQPQRRGS